MYSHKNISIVKVLRALKFSNGLGQFFVRYDVNKKQNKTDWPFLYNWKEDKNLILGWIKNANDSLNFFVVFEIRDNFVRLLCLPNSKQNRSPLLRVFFYENTSRIVQMIEM